MSTIFRRDMTQQEWVLFEDVQDPDPETVFANGLEVVVFLKNDDEQLTGEELALRSVNNLGVKFGQRHAEYLLANQEKALVEFRMYDLYFPGTIWRGSDGHSHFPKLTFYCYCWHLVFVRRIGQRLSNGDHRLIRPIQG